MEAQYGIVKAQPRNLLPETDILQVNHKRRILTARYPAFGKNSYEGNIQSMRQPFYHSAEQPEMHFRPATTSESISIAKHNLALLGRTRIPDPRRLQLGWHVNTSEGVFANVLDAQGNPIVDEKILKAHLDTCRKVNGIYLGNNDLGFVPYESFKMEGQDSGDFAESGLARLLEHTEEKIAPNLKEIFDKKYYPTGVDVFGYNESKEPVLGVSCFDATRYIRGRLIVNSDWGDGMRGCAFGVIPTGEASRTTK